MPKLDLESIPRTNSTSYPAPYAGAMDRRWFRRLAPAAGLEDFGVSHVTLQPGGISSQRHWHEGEDEFVAILEGEAVLIEDQGETVLHAGDCAAFAKGVGDGHQLVNRSDRDCVFVAVGSPAGQRLPLSGHRPAPRSRRPLHRQGRHSLLTSTAHSSGIHGAAAASSYFSMTQGSSCAASSHSRSHGWASIASI